MNAKQTAQAEQAIAAMKSGGRFMFETAQRIRQKVTGMNRVDQMKHISKVREAADAYDVVTLRAELDYCENKNINSKELEAAQIVLNNLQNKEFVITTMGEWKDKVESGDVRAVNVTVLKNLLELARNLDVDEGIIQEFAPVMQQGVKMRARATVGGTIFNAVDMNEMELSDGKFYQLVNFQGLKPATVWKGHCSSGWLSAAPCGAAAMLVHCSNEMKDALTKVAPSKEVAAVKTYRSMLRWMGDKPCLESQRFRLSEEIVNTAKSDLALSDEVYVQLMKQLTKNPSPQSVLHGWKLMLILTQQVSPSKDLDEFLRAFLLNAMRTKEFLAWRDLVEVPDIAKRCVAELNILDAPDRVISSEDVNLVPTQVFLVDNSIRKVYTQEHETLAKLGERMSEQVKICAGREFTFFQVTEGLDAPRLLPETAVLSTLLQKWKRLEEATGRRTRLLWKRRLLCVDETLRIDNRTHANLTYRQAVWDFLHYPISEDYQFICEISASIMNVEQIHYKDHLDQLDNEGVLEGLIPAHMLDDQTRSQWASMVRSQYRSLEQADGQDSCKTRHERMGRALSLMQKMKLFGAYFWFGTQTGSVPSGEVSIPDAPERECIINPKEPQAEYWICVNPSGVRFVSVDSKPGTEFIRGYLFGEEAMERILRWGAKTNTIQFVVQTVNPASPAEGRIPMTITLTSPAAIDIVYTIYMISKRR